MIAVEAALRAEAAGVRMRIDGVGTVLTCRFDGEPRDAFVALGHGRRYLAMIRLAVPLLVRTGLRIDFFAGNVCLAHAGFGVKQNILGRLLRLPATRIGT